ncbi:hypothetical protein ARMSODRAFT_980920 [Armillaria solidipes]|uniref:Uncharacterized protein n=1 Tax=Armillaria solidipes TaxID=1076256 RepID=A0A2H3ATQ8_9AGAR|nr:hypothetical protein ARMSODRAFT_980920 [Armillaria solidipes]
MSISARSHQTIARYHFCTFIGSRFTETPSCHWRIQGLFLGGCAALGCQNTKEIDESRLQRLSLRIVQGAGYTWDDAIRSMKPILYGFKDMTLLADVDEKIWESETPKVVDVIDSAHFGTARLVGNEELEDVSILRMLPGEQDGRTNSGPGPGTEAISFSERCLLDGVMYHYNREAELKQGKQQNGLHLWQSDMGTNYETYSIIYYGIPTGIRKHVNNAGRSEGETIVVDLDRNFRDFELGMD